MQSFSQSLLKEILENKGNLHTDNYEENMQYEPRLLKQLSSQTFAKRLLDKIIPINPELQITRHWFDYFNTRSFYKSVINQFHDMTFLYDLLNDDASKNLFIKFPNTLP